MLPLLRFAASCHRLIVTAVLVVLATASASTAGTVRLQWKANTEGNLAGYVVLYGTASGVYTGSFEVGPAVTSVEVPDLTDGATYFFAVRAYNTAGLQSPLSNEASVYLSPAVVPAPVITAMSPSSGLMSGNTLVTLSGANFTAGAVVRFGTTAGAVQSVTSTSITVRTPALPLGPVAVSVTLPDGQSATAPGTFTAVAPTPVISSVTPASGATNGGTSVTISGSQFVSGASVTFGGTPAAVISLSATSIVVTAPARAAGAVDVKVVNPGGPSATKAGAFTYVAAAPVVTSMSPGTGPMSGNTLVTLSGANFTSGAVVRFGTTPGTVQSVSSTSIAVRTPALPVGPVSVSVTLLDGQSATAPGTFTAVAPTPAISSVSPTSGLTSGGTSVTIAGSQFVSGASVTFGGTPATVNSLSSSAIVVTTPSRPAGSVDVKVVNPGGPSATKAAAFTYVAPAPVVAGMAPTSGPTSGGTLVTLSGANFTDGAVVRFGTTPGLVQGISSTSIVVRTPALPAGTFPVSVTLSDGQSAAAPGAFTAVAPALVISAVGPAWGPVAGGTSVTITGGSFLPGASVSVGGVPASVSSTSPTALVITTPPHAAGAVDVKVVNPDGATAVSAGAFTYRAPGPVLTSVLPANGPVAGGNVVTVAGDGFTGGTTVAFDGVDGAVTARTPTLIEVVAPARPAGTVTVTVRNEDGQTSSLPDAYTYEEDDDTGTPTSTPPPAAFVRYFAEGAQGAFFDTRFALANPHDEDASVTVTFTDPFGTEVPMQVTVPAGGHATVDRTNMPALTNEAFATRFESDVEIGIDRMVQWDAAGYGAHAETGIASPRTTWFFAEGATHSGFDLFYLLQNPASEPAEVQVRYLLGTGQVVEKVHHVAPFARTNIWVNHDHPALASAEISAELTSLNGVPIVAERSMYQSQNGQLFTAGHNSGGVAEPSTQWFLAEGATGSTFDMFVLVANPNSQAAALQVTYLLPSGKPVVRAYTVAANSRFTVWVDHEDPRLRQADVSVVVTSTNGVPVIVERTMWWADRQNRPWTEAHNSAGVTRSAPRWVVADGESSLARNAVTYALVANTSASETPVRFTLLTPQGRGRSVQTTVKGNSRYSIDVAMTFPEARDSRFGLLVESLDEAPLVVERATYWDAGGITWAAGTCSLAMPLSDAR